MPADQFVTVSLPTAGTCELWETLTAAGRSLTGAVRVVIVRGSAADFFDGSASDDAAVDGAALDGRSNEPPPGAIEWLGRPDLITVAAISGRATGVGLQVALACDLRVVADDAALAASRSVASIARLGELVGYSRALEFVTARTSISGDQAAELGLANMSVPVGALDAAVADLVAAVLRTPRAAATVAKAVLTQAAVDRRRAASDFAAGLSLAESDS